MRLLAPLLLVTLFSVGTAVNGAEPGEKFVEWLHECETIEGKPPVCALTHTVANSGGGGALLKLTIRKLGDKQTPVLVALVPLGIYLPSGVVGMVDTSPQFPLSIQTCTALGCEAVKTLNPKELWRLKDGKQLLIGFKVKRGPSTVTVPVSLSGVHAGLRSMGWQGW